MSTESSFPKYSILLTTIFISNLLLTSGMGYGQSASKMNSFINGLMAKMTLQEKIGQLNLVVGGEATTGSVVSIGVEEKIKQGKVGGIFSVSSPQRIRRIQELAVKESRLKIPIIFGMDVIHGYRTIFPIPLGMAASWDMARIEESARIAAKEATADGLNWTFSPMVDVSRDPRWGRISEGSGEDPYLGSAIAAAMVRGYQGRNLAADTTLLACVKHFALYGAPEAGRDYHSVDMSRIKMYNDYFPPYKAAIDAGVGSVMTSFNDVEGVPATGNKWLLTDVLRKQWGFKGLVVSDYTSVSEMIDHGMGDLQAVSALAVKAGLDMDMVSEGFLSTLEKSVKEGKVSQADIDRACRAVLEAKYKLGLFEDPFRYCRDDRAANEIFNAAHRKTARETAARSFVLLKNQNILPLQKKGTIGLVGPLADARENMVGTWAVSADVSKATSLLAGLRELAGPDLKVLYAKGANVTEDSALEARTSVFGKPWQRDNRDPDTLIAEALRVAAQSDVVVAAMGELAEFTGESSSRTDLNLPESQKKLLRALVASGKPVVMVLFTGRPLTIVEEDELLPAILNVWFPGSEAGYAISDVLFGAVNPSGKLPVSFPRNVGQIPIYYSYKNTGRPLEGDEFQKFRSNYLDVSNTPLYPFGYGLSYTKFDYSAVRLSKTQLKGNEKLMAALTVTNTGNLAGEEVVQLYIRDIVGSNTRPLKELKGFRKISLNPGESKEIQFEITPDMLKFYDHNLRYDWEPGEFTVFIGTNSRDCQSANFTWLR
ncbi:MAG TPA: beta-glucosidase BglX [Flavihumibacter sp.]|jgi:beta-glucosidase